MGATESVLLRGLSLPLYPGTTDVFTDMQESNIDIVPAVLQMVSLSSNVLEYICVYHLHAYTTISYLLGTHVHKNVCNVAVINDNV